MKHPFSQETIRAMELYCLSKYPEEACGFIVKNEFIPIVNKSEDKINHFEIDKHIFIEYNDAVDAIIHSHADYPHLSKADMLSQKRLGIPWGIVLINKGTVHNTVFWGGSVLYPLLQRPFIHGCFDCYAMVRDYWRFKGYDVMDFPREFLWWETDPSMLVDNCKAAGFEFIDEQDLKEGDVIFMKVLSNVTNHSGIYIGNGLMIHHLCDRFSREEPVHRWRKHITHYLRYKHA